MSGVGNAAQSAVRSDLKRRAQVYLMLSRLFRYPEPATLSCFTDRDWVKEMVSCLPSQCNAAAHCRLVGQWIEGLADEGEALRRLEVEYTRLFINAYPSVVAAPYGSLYLDTEPGVWGATTHRVLEIYREVGLEMASSPRVIPDHIAAEMEFAAYLLQEFATLGSTAVRQRLWDQFTVELFWSWAPEFLEQVATRTQNVFYREAAALARSFILFEIDSSGKTG